jgi:F420-non-reducing hydrogenase iron-sulfur subunit
MSGRRETLPSKGSDAKRPGGAQKATAAKKTDAKKVTAAKKTAAKKATATKETTPAKTGAKKATAGRDPVPGFEPRVVAFACNWCSYPAADAAGINKMQYPPNARIIRVMCAGRIHPAFVLKALELGADGVLVSGCHFADCHYLFGAKRAAEQFEKTAELVRMLGIERERVRFEQISAAEAPIFVRVMHEFVDDLKRLGRSPLAGLTDGKLEVPCAVGDETT